jgi:starch phosphorylase
MAYLAIRGSGGVNGVSRLHGAVSRRIFQPLFVRWPEVEVPVEHVTNGVHMPTWDSAESDSLWETFCGKARWQGTLQDVETNIRRASDDDLWRLRCDERRSLVEFVRERLARQLAEQGASAEDIVKAGATFDPQALTLGFARRIATYKRPNLLLHDPDRLARVLADPRRPMQLVIAGKAHPEDQAGQHLISQWMHFITRPDVRGRVVFLSDYDMLMGERLVQGVDLWINTPRRPWEACGTSGMKVLVNGGLNLSELDGWWAEAYAPEVGWALGDGRDRGEDPAWDATEAGALYALLEGEVASAFYTRSDRGLPTGWIARMRESMARLTPAFSSNRTVREYTARYYVPAARAYWERTANNGRRGTEVLAWANALERAWGMADFRSMDVHTDANWHAFQVHLNLGDLNPDDVRVELYADGEGGGGPVCQAMTRTGVETRSGPDHRYVATVAASRPASDFTPRLVPFHRDAAVPLEAPFILWYG